MQLWRKLMKENKKVTIEQGSSDDYKRVILELGLNEDPLSSTPKWDNMKVSLKEGVAEKTTLFATTFLNGIIPAFWITLVFIAFIVIGGWLLC